MTVCQLEVSQNEFDELMKCEAVCLREYERDDGSRFSKIIDMGDKEEMDAIAATPKILVVHRGVKLIGDMSVYVRDLLKPDAAS